MIHITAGELFYTCGLAKSNKVAAVVYIWKIGILVIVWPILPTHVGVVSS